MVTESDTTTQNRLAEKFHALHHAENTLVLPNAWDCASAKIFEEAGFPALATTSSGISFSCGYQDGEHIPPALMIEVVGRIARTVKIPVTADIEGGYAQGDNAAFSKFITGIIEAGAVGINLEDRNAQTGELNEITHQVRLIRQVKELSNQTGIKLFVNARTDAFMAVPGDLGTRRKIALERADAFEQAGADGIFVPFVKDMETVAFLKEHIRLPLNILMEESLDVAGLKALKVNRISTGSKPILATMSLLKKIAAALGSNDDWNPIFTNDTSYAEANKWYA